jgi:ribonuclease P protein component
VTEAAGPQRYKLPSAARLHASREFQRVYKHGVRATGAWMTAVVLRQMEPKGIRLGLSVSKDHGSAVRRNKIKRLLREAFRLERISLPADIDVVLIPRQNEAHATLVELRREVPRLVVQALEQRRRNNPHRGGAPRKGNGGRDERRGGA